MDGIDSYHVPAVARFPHLLDGWIVLPGRIADRQRMLSQQQKKSTKQTGTQR
jgi:hypothetical protein